MNTTSEKTTMSMYFSILLQASSLTVNKDLLEQLKQGCTFKGNERQLQGIYDLLRKTEYLRHEIKNINKQCIRLGRML